MSGDVRKDGKGEAMSGERTGGPVPGTRKEEDPAFPVGAAETIREQVDGGDLFCVPDGKGGYVFDGTRCSVGFARGRIEVGAGGTATVRVEALPVPPRHRTSVGRLARHWSAASATGNLMVDNGWLVFETLEIDPRRDNVIDLAVRALSFVHGCASCVLALESGAEPSALLELGNTSGWSFGPESFQKVAERTLDEFLGIGDGDEDGERASDRPADLEAELRALLNRASRNWRETSQ